MARPSVITMDELGDDEISPIAWPTLMSWPVRFPAQKLQLVRAMQRQGEIVAVTGDGVLNDIACASEAADVSIAMGERGTRSAREVAAIVLLDDNFRTIVRSHCRRPSALQGPSIELRVSADAHPARPERGHRLIEVIRSCICRSISSGSNSSSIPRSARLPGPSAIHGYHAADATAGRAAWPKGWTMILLVGVLVTLATVLSYEYALRSR